MLPRFTHEETEKLPGDGARAKFPVLPCVSFSAAYTVSFTSSAVVTETPLNGNSRGSPAPLAWPQPVWEGGGNGGLSCPFAVEPRGRLATWRHPLWSLPTFFLSPNDLLLKEHESCNVFPRK